MMEEKGRLISNAAPIDKSIIESIDECQRYFPNLFVSQSGVCCGMFVTEWQETSLI